MKKFNTAFFCDLSDKSGLGHFKRMRYLSDILRMKKNETYFIFDKKDKKFINRLSYKEKTKFIEIKKNKKLINYLDNLEIKIIIFDSYKITYSFKKYIKDNNFFTVSIVDHIKKDPCNLIFSNRIKQNIKYENGKDFFGPKYIIPKLIKRNNENINTKFNKKVFIHAGGSSVYKEFDIFYRTTFQFLKNNNLKATVLCTNNNSKLYIKKITRDIGIFEKIIIINFQNDLNKILKKFDIVIGPAGTTTYESILLGALPISFQISKDGRDCEKTWNSIGHLLHLTYSDLNKISVINDLLNLSLSNYKVLKKIMSINSKALDGKGADRITNILIKEYDNYVNKVFKINKIELVKDHKFTIKKCDYADMRDYLYARNLKKNKIVSTKPNHSISWPEHINWWINTNLFKFKIVNSENSIGFCWFKTNIDRNGQFLTSGWFLNNLINEKLKTSLFIQKKQDILAKTYFKKFNWIIITKKNNMFVYYLNKKIGFKSASTLSINRAIKSFNIAPNKYYIMEKKL